MRMSGFWTSGRRARRGAAAVEFALALPLLLLIFAGMVELGRALIVSEAVQKGLRAAGTYAARLETLDATESSRLVNLVRTGSLDPSAPYLTEAWASGGTVTVDQTAMSVGGADVTVVRLTAVLPYQPLLPGLFDFVGFDDIQLDFMHEQTVIGR